jgi:hypothetical protein
VNDILVFGGDSADIPNGTYPATLKSIVTKTSVEFGDFRAWDFELENGSIVGAGSSMSMNARSKAGRWIAALLGRVPAKGETVEVIGRPCLVQVEEDAKGWPKVVAVLPPLAATTKAGKAPSRPVAIVTEPVGELP